MSQNSFDEEKEICKTIFDERLTTEDRQWVEKQLELSGVQIPTVDLSWVNVTCLWGL